LSFIGKNFKPKLALNYVENLYFLVKEKINSIAYTPADTGVYIKLNVDSVISLIYRLKEI